MSQSLLIAKTLENNSLVILSNMANRHGLITGATGTGKTVTLQKMAESFSSIGVPVFMADVKGDLSGIGGAGVLSEKLQKRLDDLEITDWQPKSSPVTFWDVFNEKGHPIRATVSDIGPLLFSRLLNLTDVQAGVLQIVFKVADDNGLLLLDLKDLKAMLQYVGDNAAQLKTQYGNVTTASIGAIQRGLLTLEEQGGEQFLGEPMLNIEDLMRFDMQGQGMVNILAAERLYNLPTLYSTFLLWLLSDIYETLPEEGDLDKPKLVFFFDEAHLLFSNSNNALLEKIEQIIRLIRSKGVGVYFVTQNPLDIPDRILGQLGNRVQHALRAFSPRDQKAVKAAAQTMRANPSFDAEKVITELGVGEALISFLDEKGTPTMVERGTVIAPFSRMGILSPEEYQNIINKSPLKGKYEQVIDKESAYEKLTMQQPITTSTTSTTTTTTVTSQDGGVINYLKDFVFGSTGPRGGHRAGVIEKASKQVAGQVTRDFIRGILGNIIKK